MTQETQLAIASTPPPSAIGEALFTPRDFTDAVRISEHLAKSDLVPADYRGKPANILVALGWGAELGIPPLQALANISVINGRAGVWGDLLLAIVQRSAQYQGHEETIDPATLTATCKIKRRGVDKPFVASFSRADAEAAKLWTKPGPWTQYPKRMLQLRARAFALRDGFADVLRGMSMAEELEDYPEPPRRRPEPVVDVELPKRASETKAEAATAEVLDAVPVAPDDLFIKEVVTAPGKKDSGKEWTRLSVSDGEIYVTDDPKFASDARMAFAEGFAVRLTWDKKKGAGLKTIATFEVVIPDDAGDDGEDTENAEGENT